MATLADRIDALFARKQERLALQKVVDKMKEEEDVELNAIVQDMKFNEASGSTAIVKTKLVRKPVCEDWTTFYNFIKEQNDFSLLEKRVSVSGVREYWESGDEVPGIVAEESLAATLSASK